MGRYPGWTLGAAIFVLALVALGVGLSAPNELYFDETWYVPAARSLLASGEMLRQEHPPLGKLLIALSMLIFGDNPTGWRALDCVFGALTLTGLFAWTFAMTKSRGWGLFAAALGLLGGVVYVQARIAMLDIFLMGFGVWALAFFRMSLDEGITGRVAFAWLCGAGLCLGLATACKVSGAFLWFGLLSIGAVIGLLRSWGTSVDGPRPDDFFAPGRLGSRRRRTTSMANRS